MSFGRLCVLSCSITRFVVLEIQKYVICFGSWLNVRQELFCLSLFVIYVVVESSCAFIAFTLAFIKYTNKSNLDKF